MAEVPNNIVELPIPGLWFELDDYLRPRPLPNQKGLGFPHVEDMERAFQYRWGYQTRVGSSMVSSVFLALNHKSFLASRHQIQVFEVAIFGEGGTEVAGRFADIDSCVEAHHKIVRQLTQATFASNDSAKIQY